MEERIDIRAAVRERYGAIAEGKGCGCGSGGAGSTCCTSELGYSAGETAAIPEGANLGLGCGAPAALAGPKRGETVLDLGSGAGVDVFLAAREVGAQGHVIGVDMTPAMIDRARANAAREGFTNVEFRLGEIEHLPVADTSVDAIISNCVINLSPDKPQVFREAFRVLKNGGRLAISDVVTPISLPDEIKSDLALYCACLAGASPISDLQAILEECGFRQIRIAPKAESREFIKDWAPGLKLEDYVVSAVIQAIKP